MKIRMRGNSLRLRLQMSEIDKLSETGSVSETICFAPDRKLRYSIRASDDVNTLTGSFEEDEIVVIVPRKIAEDWCKTENISLEGAQVTGNGSSLNILLEKDFKCLTKREGEGDMFPNPNEDHS